MVPAHEAIASRCKALPAVARALRESPGLRRLPLARASLAELWRAAWGRR